MGTEDGARAQGGVCGGLLGGGRGRHRAAAGGLRRSRYAQPLAFLAAGVLIGFYGATLLQASDPHRAAGGGDGDGT